MSLVRRVLSVNVAQTQPMMIEGRRILTGIGKRPVGSPDMPTRVPVKALGLEGDEQADLTVHGGVSKAVYAYPHEHYAFWETVRAQAGVQEWGAPLPIGLPGENLTITGLLESDAYIGDLLKFPDCTLAISEPRRPCYKFAAVMGFPQALKMMAQSGWCGFYLSVRVPGTIAAGEPFELIRGPQEVSIADLFRAKMRKEAA